MQPLVITGFGCAFLMGATLGVIGGGGSTLTVPILVYLLGIPAVDATGYSLFIVGATALVGAVAYARRDALDFRTALIFGLPSVAGVFVARAVIVPAIPATISLRAVVMTRSQVLLFAFALFMVVMSISMIRANRRRRSPRPGSTPGARAKSAAVLVALDGLAVGVVTGLVGAGGGFLIVPALVVLVGTEIRTAVGTSLAIIAMKSLLGFAGEIIASSGIDWLTLLAFTAISIAGIAAGSALNRRIPASRLETGFAWFVLCVGVAMLISEAMRAMNGAAP